jgi:hypothetical protein|tara:strand:- start:7662 stop:7868 length:207 start_codon:yes stop_codon:yes gene_type:complete
MAKYSQSGSKAQRQNQYVRRLIIKINRHKSRGLDTSNMEKELSYCSGDATRPEFKTGRDVGPKLKKTY